MIIKSFELKNKLKNNKFFLIYGNNKGAISEIINETLINYLPQKHFKYEENEVLKDLNTFKQNIFNQSFFENEKLVIINRATDKIHEIIEEIIFENVNDLFLIVLSGPLDKKSKIRKLFENEKQTVCVPVYEDNLQTLNNIVIKFMRERKINISQQMVNIISERAAGDRINLKNELEKIENYSLNKKAINVSDILKITNLSENYSISELVDNCLSKNKTKIFKILNENNFSSEDCIIILRTFLLRAKKILGLSLEYDKNKDINKTINSAKPPIFWKEKDIVRAQLNKWKPEKIKDLIYLINNIELQVKKDYKNSILIVTDFILAQGYSQTSN